jgi:hypothetical protein
MARTAVELPDPLENAGAGGAVVNSADDLLAQLAGDEVDRLMSEVDATPPDPAHADRARDAAPGASADAGEWDALDSPETGHFLRDLDEREAAAQPTPAPEASPDDDNDEAAAATPMDSRTAQEMIARRADTLVARARREASEAEAAEAADLSVAPTPTGSTAPPPVPASAPDALAAEMEADEAAHAAALRRMSAPGAAAAEPAVAAPAVPTIDESAIDFSPALDGDPEDAPPRVPFLVRALELLNAPLAGLSAGVREAMGKVALITAVNAIAVFVYVLVFRKH